MFIVGAIQIVAWVLCFEFCLTESTTGGNFYLGLITGFLAIAVGVLGISYLCFLRSCLVIISLIVDVPLVFASSIALVISAVSITEELRNLGGGAFYLVVQSVMSGIIALFSTIFAVQYCCIQSRSLKEEDADDEERTAGVRRGPERYNPYVDDDSRILPNGNFSGVPRILTQNYIVSTPTSRPSGSSDSNVNRQERGRPGNRSNPTQQRATDRLGRTASEYLGRRPPRSKSPRYQPNGRSRGSRSPRDSGTIGSFQMGPIIGNGIAGGSREQLTGNTRNHEPYGLANDWLPDFDTSEVMDNEARYGDNSNYFF